MMAFIQPLVVDEDDSDDDSDDVPVPKANVVLRIVQRCAQSDSPL